MSSHPPNKTPPPPARAAIAQLTSTSNKVSNLINTAKCAGWGQREGASMLFLPECFGFLGENADRTLEQAEPPVVVGSNSSGGVDDASEESVILHDLLRATVASCAKGETPPETASTAISPAATIGILEGLRVIAQASGLWISGGGMHVAGAPPAENGSDRPRVYNTHVILNEQGVVQCLYPKIHLFDVHIPGKVQRGWNRKVFNPRLYIPLSEKIVQTKEQYPDYEVVIAGHSLGAALSILFGAYVAKYVLPDEKNVAVINLGAPRVGDETFFHSLNQIPNLTIWRMVFREDIVPRCPPMWLGYRHVGHMLHWDENDQVKAYHQQLESCMDSQCYAGIQPSEWNILFGKVGHHEHSNYKCIVDQAKKEPERYWPKGFEVKNKNDLNR